MTIIERSPLPLKRVLGAELGAIYRDLREALGRARLAKRDRTPVSELANGEGRVLTVEGQRLAVSKNEHGELQAVSAVCTHLGCIVDFNSAERTWDCACHGSRFETDGTVIQGPAKRPLERKSPLSGGAPQAAEGGN